MDEQDRQSFRLALERLIRLAPLTGFSASTDWSSSRMWYGISVNAGLHPEEPPPLTPWQQLFLSAVLGEPIPRGVLLGALEDSGIYPDGVMTAVESAEDEPLDMGRPVYVDGESWEAGDRRFREVARGWYNGQKSQVFGVCKGLWGRGNAGIGNLFGRFLDDWLGRRKPAVGRVPQHSLWPTTDYLRTRMGQLPPLPWVFRHLRLTANRPTAELLTALIHHLER